VALLENFDSHYQSQGEKQCEFYMRNGSCKYGATCKYNHPDPMAVGGSDLTSAFVNGGTTSLPAPSPSSVGSWSSPRALNDPTPFVPYVFSPTRLPSQSSEWNGYQVFTLVLCCLTFIPFNQVT
jgi:hypothetical protein